MRSRVFDRVAITGLIVTLGIGTTVLAIHHHRQVGVQQDGSIVVPTGQTITSAGTGSSRRPPKGTVNLNDSRRFAGLYAHSDVALTPSTSLLAGLRWNITHESREEVRVNSRGVKTITPGVQDVDRLTGSLVAVWWRLTRRWFGSPPLSQASRKLARHSGLF